MSPRREGGGRRAQARAARARRGAAAERRGSPRDDFAETRSDEASDGGPTARSEHESRGRADEDEDESTTSRRGEPMTRTRLRAGGGGRAGARSSPPRPRSGTAWRTEAAEADPSRDERPRRGGGAGREGGLGDHLRLRDGPRGEDDLGLQGGSPATSASRSGLRFLTASLPDRRLDRGRHLREPVLYLSATSPTRSSTAASLQGVKNQLAAVDGGAPRDDPDPRLRHADRGSSGKLRALRHDDAPAARSREGAIALFSLPRDLKVKIPGSAPTS